VISLADLRAAEGQPVTVALSDGTVLADCVIVSVGRLWARSVWLVKGDTDLFTDPEDIEGIKVLGQREAA
jgi:hypothetical protein